MARMEAVQKVTLTLPTRLVEDVRELVSAGEFASQAALIREALEKELKRARDDRLRREFEQAAQDPRFLRDLDETMEAFASADAETARMIPE